MIEGLRLRFYGWELIKACINFPAHADKVLEELRKIERSYFEHGGASWVSAPWRNVQRSVSEYRKLIDRWEQAKKNAAVFSKRIHSTETYSLTKEELEELWEVIA